MRFRFFQKTLFFLVVLISVYIFSLQGVQAQSAAEVLQRWEASRNNTGQGFIDWVNDTFGLVSQETSDYINRINAELDRIEATCVSPEDCQQLKEQVFLDNLQEGKDLYKKDFEPKDSPTLIANFVGWILFWIATFFSWLVSLLIEVMVYFAQYNNFLNHNIVKTGWQIVRDICNNFFIVGLLVISVATILRQPASYQYQQALGKLLVMAVLINFSKLFTGILIDVSQVITIYFANALHDKGAAIILYALGLWDLYRYRNDPSFSLDNYGGAIQPLLFALILSVIAAVVVAAIVMVLVYRIIALWFLVILSPAAFLAKAIPGQEKYFSEWLSTLSKELIVAPVMLFFLYLSLFAGAVNPNDVDNIKDPGNVGAVPAANRDNALNLGGGVGDDTATFSGRMVNFLLIVGLLVGSLVAGQRVGAKGSSWAGAGVAKLDGWRKKGKAWGIDRAKDAAVGSWSLAKATGRGIDKALPFGLAGRVGGVISSATTKSGGVGGAIAGAIGVGVGASLGGPVGAAIGAGIGTTLGSVLTGKAGQAVSSRIKRQRAIEQNRYKASIGDGKTDEALDEKGERAGLQVVRDKSGNITAVKDDSGAAITDVDKKINLWNESKGVYERAKFDGTRWDFDTEKQITPGGEQARDNNGNIVTEKQYGLNYKTADGRYTNVKEDAVYEWNDGAGAYVKLEDDQVLRKEDNTAQTRWAEYEAPDGKKYRKTEENGNYYEFDGSKNEFVKDEKGKFIAATNAWGNEIKTMSSRGQAFYNGYSSGMNKSYAASNAAEAERISKIQKEFDGLPKEQLRQLLDVERDGAKLTAIALTMGLKKAFKETDVVGVNKAKEALQSNPVLLKQFNDEMNKKFAVLNNSKLGKDNKVEINDAELAKMVSAGDMKWADQNVKQMTPEALKIMAKQLGVDFHKELEKMIKTDRDKIAIGGALDKSVTGLGFSGEELALRKSAGAINGDWIRAFSSTVNGVTQVNQAALTTAIKQIPKPEIFATVNDSNFSNNEFKRAIAMSMNVSMLSKMSKNYEVSTEKMRRYADMIKEFAGDANPNKDGTPEERAAYLVSQAKNNTNNSDLKTYFM